MLVALVPGTPAWAHNALRSATPPRDATLSIPPEQVVLEFLQRLDPSFTTIVVTDAHKQRIPSTAPSMAGTCGTITLNQVLANGAYTVAYRVVSTDGHRVQGAYPFTVAVPGAPSPTPVAVPATTAAAGLSTEDDRDAGRSGVPGPGPRSPSPARPGARCSG